MPKLRNFLCGAMAFVFPASLVAADASPAMLHSKAGVWVNGNPVPPSLTIFPDDLVQTQPGSIGNIDADGSTVTIQPEAVLQYEGDALVLEHGTVLLGTGKQMQVRVGCIAIIPAAAAWTQYQVTDIDGKLTVTAQKGDVVMHQKIAANVKSKSPQPEVITVHQGEQASRDERCAPKPQSAPGYVGAKGAILDSPWVKYPSAAAIAVLACWALCRTDDPVSPSRPDR